jgi:hypothetical protein
MNVKSVQAPMICMAHSLSLLMKVKVEREHGVIHVAEEIRREQRLKKVKKAHSYGAIDPFGDKAIENVVTIHDFHASILHLLGLDHERVSFHHNGIEWRRTIIVGFANQRALRRQHAAIPVRPIPVSNPGPVEDHHARWFQLPAS